MKLLTATTATQGQPGDFHHCTNGELVMFPSVICDRDVHDPATGGCSCDCGRSFIGLHSHRGTTTAEITDLDISLNDYADAIRDSLDQQGWDSTGALNTALLLVNIADLYPIGTVIGDRHGGLYIRRHGEHL